MEPVIRPAPADSGINPTGSLESVTPPRGPIRGLVYSTRAIVGHRELLWLLVQREIKARYKDSSLGFLWSLFRPLTQLAIYYVAIGKFLQAERSIPEFAIFVFTGLTVWALFSEILSSSTTSMVSNAGLIKKVYLPREIFPLSSVGSAMFNFFIQFAILLVATIAIGSPPITPYWFFIPLGFVVIVLFAFAFGLVLAATNVYLRDVQHLVEVLLLVLFWASPIVYSYGFVNAALQGSWIEAVYLSNPVTIAVLGFQRAMWVAGADQSFPPDLTARLVIMAVIGLILIWVGQRIFARLEGNFAQEL